MLSFKYVFGFRADLQSNINYLDNSIIIFVSGHNVVFHHLETRAQRVLPGSADKDRIQAICLSPTKKFIAVGETGESATVSIFDTQSLKKKKMINLNDIANSKDIASIAFNHDGHTLAVQCGAPDWILSLWLWEKSKHICSSKTSNPKGDPILQVSFSPYDSSYLSACGINTFRMFKSGESGLKLQITALSRRDTNTYLCQCWSLDHGSERLLTGTNTGELVVMEGYEVIWNYQIDKSTPIHTIKCYNKGIVIGTGSGYVMFFHKDDKEVYKEGKSFLIPRSSDQQISSLTLSPNEEMLVCTTNKNQVYVLSVANIDFIANKEKAFSQLPAVMHSGGIYSADVSLRKPFIATCSADKTIKIWNYAENMTEMTKEFSEVATSLAIHPNGLLLLAGFADKVQVMMILMEDLKVVHEMNMRGCREIMFSNGGQYYAIITNTVIHIYNTYTYACIRSLKGHNSKVNSLFWSLDDSRLLSGGSDGAIYEWSLKDFKRERENVIKGCSYHSVTAMPDMKQIYSVGTDLKLKTLKDIQGASLHVSQEIDTDINLTRIACLSTGDLLFAGTSRGCIRSYQCPLSGEFIEYKCMSGPVTNLLLTTDESILIATGEDGSVFLFDIKTSEKENTKKIAWSEEVLVVRSEINEKHLRISELELQVNELTMQTEYQLRLKDMDMAEKLKQEAARYQKEIGTEKQKLEALVQERNEMELEYEERLRQLQEKSSQQMNALDSQYQLKIMKEVERYQRLVQEKEILNEKWDEQNALLVQSHEILIRELTEEYEEKLHKQSIACAKLEAEHVKTQKAFDEIKRQIEEDADREIEDIKENYELSLNHEKETGLRLKGQNGIMKKKFESLQKDIGTQKDEIRTLFEEKKKLYRTIAILEKDVQSLKKEIRERDETIADKEKRIYNLKKKNQDLEKFKFVLDYKIKELKGQIEPKEKEIEEYNEHVMEMDKELEKYKQINLSLDLMVYNLKLKESVMSKEMKNETKWRIRAVVETNAIKADINDAVQFIQDPKSLKLKVRSIYQKYVQGNYSSKEQKANFEEESQRQRYYLEKRVEGLKMKLCKESEVQKIIRARTMQENAVLIKEVNELRKDIQMMPRQAVESKEALYSKELEAQYKVISNLRQELLEKENKILEMERMVMARPASRERLPPIDFQKNI